MIDPLQVSKYKQLDVVKSLPTTSESVETRAGSSDSIASTVSIKPSEWDRELIELIPALLTRISIVPHLSIACKHTLVSDKLDIEHDLQILR